MLSSRRFLRLRHFAHHELEIIAEFASDSFLDVVQTRRVKLRPPHVAKLRDAGLVLKKLHGVEIVEDLVMHVEGGERNAATAAADEKFLLASGDIRHGRPRKLKAGIRDRM